MLSQIARQAIVRAQLQARCQHSQIKLLAEGSSKVTVDVNRTRNLPITGLALYPLGHQALSKLPIMYTIIGNLCLADTIIKMKC